MPSSPSRLTSTLAGRAAIIVVCLIILKKGLRL